MLHFRRHSDRSPKSASPGVAGLLALGAALASAQAQAQTEVPPTSPKEPMTFELVDTAGLCDDCTVVQASGRFVEGTGSDFWGFVARSRLRNTVVVVLDSTGGSLENAVTVGRGIRHLKAGTVVGRAVRKSGAVEIAPGRCTSACTMAFVGGTRRSVPEASIFGVHSWMPTNLADPPAGAPGKTQPFDRRAVQNIHTNNARYMAHLDHMGIDLRLMIRAFQTPFERLTRLHPLELKDYRVVTDESTIRVVPDRSRPVLVLPQPAPSGQATRGRRA
jgi:hypothetical protein